MFSPVKCLFTLIFIEVIFTICVNFFRMVAPTIQGDPKIVQDEAAGSVFLDVVVLNVEPAKTKWFSGEDELEQSGTYKFSHSDEGAGKKKLRCEIKVNYNFFLYIWYLSLFVMFCLT